MAPTPAAERAQPGITNTQEADGDGGEIVKVHGDHLIVLWCGRLFTVAVGDRSMVRGICHGALKLLRD